MTPQPQTAGALLSLPPGSLSWAAEGQGRTVTARRLPRGRKPGAGAGAVRSTDDFRAAAPTGQKGKP